MLTHPAETSPGLGPTLGFPALVATPFPPDLAIKIDTEWGQLRGKAFTHKTRPVYEKWEKEIGLDLVKMAEKEVQQAVKKK